MKKVSFPALSAAFGLSALIASGSASAAALLTQSFTDADGTPLSGAALVPGVASYVDSGLFAPQATIAASAALSYPGILSSGNGYGPVNGPAEMFLDVSPSGPLAAYVANGVVGGTGSGTIYVSWMIRGADTQSGNLLILADGASEKIVIGTLFSTNGYRLLTTANPTGGNQNYQNSGVLPSTTGADFIVAKITFGAGSTDTVQLFINQLTEGTPVLSTAADRHTKFNKINLASFGSASCTYDEIRVGATYADVAPASLEAAPANPTGLQATTTSFSEVTLTWTDNATNELNYLIERSPNGVDGWTTAASTGIQAGGTVTFLDTGLTAGTTYHYRVSASNSGGVSGFSNIASTTTSFLPDLVPLDTIYLGYTDPDGTNASLATPVPGITAFTEPGLIQATSALTYTGVPTSGNGFTLGNSAVSHISLDTTLPGFARYLSGGQIGGSGLGTLYVSWLARGINGQEADGVEFRTGSGAGSIGTVSIGTTFGFDVIRLVTASSATSGTDTYVNTAVAPSTGTDLYVAKFTFGPGNTSTVELFLNQLSEGTPDAVSTGVARFNTISYFKFGGGAAPAIDELRIGTSYASVLGASALTPIQTWFGSFGLPTNGSGSGAYTADPDGDGIVNLLEYALAGVPTTAGASILPVTSVQNVGGTNYLTISFRRLTSATPGISYTPQASSDLADWTGVPVQVGSAVSNGDGKSETVVFRYPTPVSPSTKQFLRVRVTAP